MTRIIDMPHVLWILISCILFDRAGAQVPGAVQIDPQNQIVDDLLDALGIDIGGDEGPLVDRWYFWLIIGIVILLFIVAVYFTVRGFMRYARTRKENQIQSIFEQSKIVEYYDSDTEEYIKEVGRRTGRPPERVAQRAAVAKDIEVTKEDVTNNSVSHV